MSKWKTDDAIAAELKALRGLNCFARETQGNHMTDLDPFQSSFEETRLTDGASFPPGTYWLVDGPGITDMGSNSLERMSAHASAGGEFIHQVNPDGTLEHPGRMWPGRGYEGMRVKVDGTVLADKLRQNRKVNCGTPAQAKPPAPWYRRFDKR